MAEAIFICGPEGSGKRTFANAGNVQRYPFVNNTLDKDEKTSKKAQLDVSRHIAENSSFISSQISGTKYLTASKNAGMNTTLIFISTNDPKINIERLDTNDAQRITESYKKSLNDLPKSIKSAHQSIIYDNSTHAITVAVIEKKQISITAAPPKWLIPALKELTSDYKFKPSASQTNVDLLKSKRFISQLEKEHGRSI